MKVIVELKDNVFKIQNFELGKDETMALLLSATLVFMDSKSANIEEYVREKLLLINNQIKEKLEKYNDK